MDSKDNKMAPPLPLVEVLLTIEGLDISMLQRVAESAPPPFVAVEDCTVDPLPKCMPLEGQMYWVSPVWHVLHERLQWLRMLSIYVLE